MTEDEVVIAFELHYLVAPREILELIVYHDCRPWTLNDLTPTDATPQEQIDE